MERLTKVVGSSSAGRIGDHTIDSNVEVVVSRIRVSDILLQVSDTNRGAKIEETREGVHSDGELLGEVGGLAVGEDIGGGDSELGEDVERFSPVIESEVLERIDQESSLGCEDSSLLIAVSGGVGDIILESHGEVEHGGLVVSKTASVNGSVGSEGEDGRCEKSGSHLSLVVRKEILIINQLS